MMAKECGKCTLKIIPQTEGGRGRVGSGGNGRCQTWCGIRFGISGMCAKTAVRDGGTQHVSDRPGKLSCDPGTIWSLLHGKEVFKNFVLNDLG